jgi:hypothetical protein
MGSCSSASRSARRRLRSRSGCAGVRSRDGGVDRREGCGARCRSRISRGHLGWHGGARARGRGRDGEDDALGGRPVGGCRAGRPRPRGPACRERDGALVFRDRRPPRPRPRRCATVAPGAAARRALASTAPRRSRPRSRSARDRSRSAQHAPRPRGYGTGARGGRRRAVARPGFGRSAELRRQAPACGARRGDAYSAYSLRSRPRLGAPAFGLVTADDRPGRSARCLRAAPCRAGTPRNRASAPAAHGRAPGLGRQPVLRTRDRPGAAADGRLGRRRPGAARTGVLARPHPRPPRSASGRHAQLPARGGRAPAADGLRHRGGLRRRAA